MSSPGKLTANYKNVLFQIDVKEEDTVLDFKYSVYTAIGLKPSRQSFPELNLQDNFENNNWKLRLVNLHCDAILKVVDKFGEVYSVLSWKLKVKWQNIYFKVYLEEKDTILDLKCLIREATGLKLSHQSFDNLDMCANLNENDCAMQHFRNLNQQFVLEVTELPIEAEISSLTHLKVQWANIYFKIDIASGETILGVKSRIYTVTDLKPASQVFLNLFFPSNMHDEDCLLDDLKLESRFLLRISGELQKQFSSAKTSAKVKEQHSQSYDENELQELSAPRLGKRLVVLDIDHTITDYHAPKPRWAARPYLQTFLEGIYDEFDIGAWSATNMRTALSKLRTLGMLTSPNYKILFCMSEDAMTQVTMNRNRYRVKPLSKVWMEYPQFNPRNTLICDDRKHNFLLNKRNGIHVKPYYAEDRASDNELLLLLRYLKHIAQLEDVRILSHMHWRQYGIKESASSSSEEEGDFGSGCKTK